MQIIHFTRGADPLNSEGAQGAHFLPLADGQGDTHLSCTHLDPGAIINAPSLTHAAALLVVHGRITITQREMAEVNINIRAGMGAVVGPNEPHRFRSDPGAMVLVLGATKLTPHARGISSPEGIAGQTWPSDAPLHTNP